MPLAPDGAAEVTTGGDAISQRRWSKLEPFVVATWSDHSLYEVALDAGSLELSP